MQGLPQYLEQKHMKHFLLQACILKIKYSYDIDVLCKIYCGTEAEAVEDKQFDT